MLTVDVRSLIARLRWQRKMWMLMAAALVACLFVAAEGADNKANADPCFFSQPEMDQWLSENGGGYHVAANAGWGDSLTKVENQYAGCPGTWGDFVAPGNRCGWTGQMQWRVWAQSDGDFSMIAFRDRGIGTNPRYVAKCQAGTQNPGGSWEFHFWEP